MSRPVGRALPEERIRGRRRLPLRGFGFERCVHDLFKLYHQRDQPGQHLRHHRPGLHHGVRHREDAELRPWRCHHGGGLRLLLRCRPLSASGRGGGGACHVRLHDSGHHRGAPGLQAPASGAVPGGAHHGHWRQLLSAELGAPALDVEPQDLSLGGGKGDPEVFRRAALHLLRHHRHHRHLRGHHAGSDLVYGQDPHGQGHARLLGGQGGRAADGDQRRCHDLHDLRHRLGAGCRGGGAALLRLPDPDADDGFHARHQGLHGGGLRRHRLHPRSPVWRPAAGRHRDLREGLHLDAALGRRGVRRSDRGAPGEARRAPRRTGSGEGVAR